MNRSAAPCSFSRSVCAFFLAVLALSLCDCRSGWPSIKSEVPSVSVQKRWDTSVVSKKVFWADYLWQTFSSVTVGPAALYVGSSEGDVYAIDKDEGKILWKKRLKGAVFSAPLLIENASLLIVGNEAGELVALDPIVGDIRWRYQDKAPIRSAPAYEDGFLFVLTADGTLHALRSTDGTWVWDHERSMLGTVSIRELAKSPLVKEGILYAGFLDGYLVAFQAKTGEVLWSKNLVDDRQELFDVFTPVLVNDTLFVSAFEGGVYALNPKDGSVQWHYDLWPLYRHNAGPIAVSQDGDVYVSVGAGGIHALDRQGNIRWRQIIKDGGQVSQPIVWDDYLVFGASEKGLYIVDRKTGALSNYYRITRVNKGFSWLVPWNGITTTPTIVGSRVYFLTNQERVYALDLSKDSR